MLCSPCKQGISGAHALKPFIYKASRGTCPETPNLRGLQRIRRERARRHKIFRESAILLQVFDLVDSGKDNHFFPGASYFVCLRDPRRRFCRVVRPNRPVLPAILTAHFVFRDCNHD